MKKRIYGMAAVVLFLTACGKNDINIGRETVSAETVQESESKTETETEAAEEFPAEETEISNRPLNVELSAEYEGEWDEKGAIITADCSTVHILDDGYQELKNAVEGYNEKNWQEVYEIYLDSREYAKTDDFTAADKLYISREIEITRADSRILSFTDKESSYLGGAHGNYYSSGVVFDAQTGETLRLSDVVNDQDAVAAYVLEKINEQYDPEELFEGYEDMLDQCFSSGESTGFEWNMDMEGIGLIFNPYTIAPWATGTIRVKLPFESGLIREEYHVTTERPILRVNEDEPFVTDAGGDGLDAEYVVYAKRNEETYTTALTVESIPDTELAEDGAEPKKRTQEFEFYGELKYLYLVTAKDGKKYLYAELLSENDWHSMEVIDLFALSDERDAYVGKAGGATYGHFISDSDSFLLYERIFVLGTYTGYKTYSVGNDGMPVTDSTLYEIVNRLTGREVGLTTKKNLKVQLHMSGSDETVETIIRKGTVLYPKRTDGETVMEMETEDGRICDLSIEKTEIGTFTIGGVSENDCFESLPYAG